MLPGAALLVAFKLERFSRPPLPEPRPVKHSALMLRHSGDAAGILGRSLVALQGSDAWGPQPGWGFGGERLIPEDARKTGGIIGHDRRSMVKAAPGNGEGDRNRSGTAERVALKDAEREGFVRGGWPATSRILAVNRSIAS